MIQRFVPNRTISQGHGVITQYGLVQCDFLTADYFLTFLRDKCSCRSCEITIITLFFFFLGRAKPHNGGSDITSYKASLSPALVFTGQE